ncbi:MAG: hypothetical protein ACKOS8_00565 [Gemmataceae bacterium]
MLLFLASLLMGQPVVPQADRPPTSGVARPHPSLRELAWRADAVVLASLAEGKPGSVEILEVISGEPGSPGKFLTISNRAEGGWSLPPGTDGQWRWLLLFLAKSQEVPAWTVLQGGWRGSTGGEQVFGPDQGVQPGTATLSWDNLMERTRGDLRSVVALRGALSVAPGIRDPGILDWLGRNAASTQDRHPEAVWPGAATAALDALYASPDPNSRWAAARMEKRGGSAPFKRGEPFVSVAAFDHLLAVLTSGSTPPGDLPLAWEALAAAIQAGAKPTPDSVHRLEELVAERVSDKSVRAQVLRLAFALAPRKDLLPQGPVRKNWLKLAESSYRAARKGADRDVLARTLLALGDAEAYQRAGGNPAGVLLVVEGLTADGFRLKGVLRQAGNPMPVAQRPVLRLERVAPASSAPVVKEEPIGLTDPAEWQAGWKGPDVVPFSVNLRGLDLGTWRLTVRVKNDTGLNGSKTGDGWWVSEPWWFQIKSKEPTPSGKNEPGPVVIDPEAP